MWWALGWSTGGKPSQRRLRAGGRVTQPGRTRVHRPDKRPAKEVLGPRLWGCNRGDFILTGPRESEDSWVLPLKISGGALAGEGTRSVRMGACRQRRLRDGLFQESWTKAGETCRPPWRATQHRRFPTHPSERRQRVPFVSRPVEASWNTVLWQKWLFPRLPFSIESRLIKWTISGIHRSTSYLSQTVRGTGMSKMGGQRKTQRGQGGPGRGWPAALLLFSVLHLASPRPSGFLLSFFHFLMGESPNLTVHWHHLHFKRLKFLIFLPLHWNILESRTAFYCTKFWTYPPTLILTPAEPGQGWTLRESVNVMGSTTGRECSSEKWVKDSCLVTPDTKKTVEGGFGLLDSNSPDAQSLPITASAAEDTFNLLSPKASSKACLPPCLGQLNNYIQLQSLHSTTSMQSVRGSHLNVVLVRFQEEQLMDSFKFPALFWFPP